MLSVDNPSGIAAILNMLSRVCDSTLNYWLNRIRLAAEASGYPLQNFRPDFLDAHRERLFDLIRKATPLPDVQAKTAELVMLMDPVMRAHGHHAGWLPVVRGLAVAMYDCRIDDVLLLANLWRAVGRCYRHLGDGARAVQSFKIAESLANGWSEAVEDFAAEVHQEMAGVRVTQLRFDEAEAAARELLTAARQRGDRYTLALGHVLFAYAYIHNDRYAAAFTQAQQALVTARAIKEGFLEAQALHYMAEACRLAKCLDRAAHYLALAQGRVEALGDTHWEALLMQARGSLLVQQGRHAEAVEDLRRAREHFAASADSSDAANCGHALGLALARSGDYEAAVAALEEAIEGWKTLGKGLEAAETCYTLGWVYRWQGRPDLARNAFEQAWQLIKDFPVNGLRGERLKGDLQEELGGDIAWQPRHP